MEKRAYSTPQLHVQGFPVPVKRSIRYLGVQLDTRLSFVEHATSVAAGAKRAVVALGRLMPNVGKLSRCKCSLLMSVIHSQLLYGAQVWADSAQSVRRSEDALLQAQRVAALRVTRCYRTVLDMAALVLVRMLPAFLLASYRKRIAKFKKSGTSLPRLEDTRETLQQWQSRWDSTPKAV